MAAIPQSVQQVEKQVELMVEDIQKKHLLPKQKEAFLCCAKCCDTNDNVQQLQGWYGHEISVACSSLSHCAIWCAC
jgi:Eukaryotic protein of unknown function (DUF842)